MQFEQITAYKCKACGKVLTTEKGIKSINSIVNILSL